MNKIINALRRFLNIYPQEEYSGIEYIKKDPSLSTAIVMVEIALSDNEFSDKEKDIIIKYLNRKYGLSEEECNNIIRRAEKIVNIDTNKWKFTKILNNIFSNQEKYNLIKQIWKMIYSDEKLHKYEDYLIHRLSKILHIRHDKMIEAKLNAMEEKE
ncbi:MAG: TerB family tellurite resistance protein [Elusimicrobiota bacterium]